MKRKKATPRRFAVRATARNLELAKAGSALTLQIYSKDEKLGELQVGRGSLFWWGAHSPMRRRLRWSDFAEKMNELAYSPKPRS